MTSTIEFPGYQLSEHIGSSRQTDVWKAFQGSVCRAVTLRILKPELAIRPEAVRRFLEEARQTAPLKHPAILDIYNVCEHDQHYALVMEHVPGSTLEHLLRRVVRLPLKQALKIALQLVNALGYAWASCRLIHRNVTPRNVIVGEDGEMKLVYTGLSLRVAPQIPSGRLPVDVVEGTPAYMSPEQASGSSALDCRSDMYSLGATFYHMVTGVCPFDGLNSVEVMRRHISGTLPHPNALCPELPPSVAILLRRLMMKDPARRFADWQEVGAMLERMLAGTIIVPPRTGIARAVAEIVSTIPDACDRTTKRIRLVRRDNVFRGLRVKA